MLETESVLDRRRLRRSVSFWRGIGIAALALATGFYAFGGDQVKTMWGQKQIARVSIEGTITESREQLQMLKEIAESDDVAGVLLYVNSPGGTTSGGEALYNALRQISAKKPIVAQFGTVAASAGYIVGLGTDHIIARGNTVTGSVGVIFQWPEVADLLGKVGVKVNEVKSGVLKAAPSPFEPLTEPGRQVAQSMVDDGFKWFIDLVERRRNIKPGAVPGLVEGRIFSGREALSHKLVDQIGGEEEALAWLKTERKVDKDAKVIDWKPKTSSGYGFSAAIGHWVKGLVGAGVAGATDAILGNATGSGLALDGLLSVWHPAEK